MANKCRRCFVELAGPKERYCSVKCNLLFHIKLDGECWSWTGAINDNDYPIVGMRGKTKRAHRVSYEVFTGPIPDGLQLDHLCRNRRCINPDHLEPVTRIVNSRRGVHSKQIGQWNRKKTHCPKGHPYIKSNIYYSPHNGGRNCRACIRARAAARRVARHAARKR